MQLKVSADLIYTTKCHNLVLAYTVCCLLMSFLDYRPSSSVHVMLESETMLTENTAFKAELETIRLPTLLIESPLINKRHSYELSISYAYTFWVD